MTLHTCRPKTAIGCALIFVSLAVADSDGYRMMGPKWRNGSVRMYLALGAPRGRLSDGAGSWNSVAETSLREWNKRIKNVQLQSTRVSSVPRGLDGYNTVSWTRDLPSEVLGRTSAWSYRGELIDADVVFNARSGWNSYRGKQVRGVVDLRRVAIHEFGHVLGLHHPDQYGQRVSAIMNARVSNTDRLMSDDIAGGQKLYGMR